MSHVSGRKPYSDSSAADSTTQSGSNGREGLVTNYRSFAELQVDQGNRSGANRSSDPAGLVATREVLLEDQRSLNENAYRGFSTSMHDMYIETEFERVDCCAMVCGGIFQSDRDRFLLQGIAPPTIARRLWIDIVIPLAIFALAASGAMRILDNTVNQLLTSSSVVLLIAYLVLLCFKGRSDRTKTRKDLLWTKAQLQDNRNQNLAVLLEQQPPDDFNQEQDYYLGQTQRDFGCAHPCCILGFYEEDRAAYELRLPAFNEDNTNEQAAANQHQSVCDSRRRHANLSRCLWDYTCPAIWCGHQLQFCGICAVAQEAREVESAILPAAYRRIDYISMQPISHYYPAIYKKRHGGARQRDGSAGVFRGWATSSRDSRHGGSPVMEDTSLQRLADQDSLHGSEDLPSVPLSNLSWQLIQFAATVTVFVFLWSLLGTFFLKYALNLPLQDWKIFDLKDFTVFLAVGVQALVLTTILSYLCNHPCPTNLSLDAMIKFFAAGFCLSTVLAVVWELVLGMLARTFISLAMAISGVDAVVDEDGYTSDWMLLGSNNFVAGKTESDNFLLAFGRRHPVFYTFYLAFASFILAAFVEEVCKYFGYRMVEHPDFMTQREIEEAMAVVIQQGDDEGDDEEGMRRQEIRRRQQQELEQLDFSKQKKSVQSVGAAITLSMTCVAMGFTCCENLVYIFIYSGNSFGTHISVLIARSLFPVHPIAAALQSIYVIERDVEVTRTARLGRILTPAVIFHGTYDFFILWIEFLSERNGTYIEDTFDFAGVMSFAVSTLVIGSAVVFYLISASRQRSRLQVTDAGVDSGESIII